MGIAIAFQLPSGLFIGGLMGLQKQVQANSIQISWGIFRGFGAVLILWLFSPTIYAFAFWQLISNVFYCFWSRFSLWRLLAFGASQLRPHFNWRVFRYTWRYAAGMAGTAVLTAILTQTDKLVVSKLLTLETLGYYTLAGALAMVPTMLASPIASAVFPRLTGLVESKDNCGVTQLYHRTCELVGVAIIPAGLTIVFFAGDCIFVWTGSPSTAQQAGLIASLLIGGQIVQAILVTPYYLALAHGNVRMNLMLGIASVALITPMLIYLIMKYGVVGAGFSWLFMNICTLPPYMYFLHRKFLPGELLRWYNRGLVRPMLTALPCVLLGIWLVPHTTSRLVTLCWIVVVWASSVAVTAITVTEIRCIVLKRVFKLFGASYATK
jgi:O-antigen/teichoic acid export membrane protein